MPYPTTKAFARWAVNFVIVLGAFLITDIVYHFAWPTPNPYMDNLVERLLYTAFFAAIYAHIYDKASQEFLLSSSKFINGLVFSVLFCVIIFMAVGLLLWVGAAIYIHVLHGFHGAPPPPELRDSVVLSTQVVVGGGTLSLLGKTEDNPR